MFDPIAGMRAMADIQAEGLRAAGELLERMLRSEPDGHRSNDSQSPSRDYTALVDAWTELLRRTVAGMATGDPGAVTVPVDAAGVGPPLRIAVNAVAEADSVTEVWLHNGTAAAVGPLVLSCGLLSDASGTPLTGAGVVFEPRRVELLPARSSRAVAVTLSVTGSVPSGVYRGTIQAHGAPKLWVPLEVVIDS